LLRNDHPIFTPYKEEILKGLMAQIHNFLTLHTIFELKQMKSAMEEMINKLTLIDLDKV